LRIELSIVRFYALLFAGSCRPELNCPAAETEGYFDNRYMFEGEAKADEKAQHTR